MDHAEGARPEYDQTKGRKEIKKTRTKLGRENQNLVQNQTKRLQGSTLQTVSPERYLFIFQTYLNCSWIPTVYNLLIYWLSKIPSFHILSILLCLNEPIIKKPTILKKGKIVIILWAGHLSAYLPNDQINPTMGSTGTRSLILDINLDDGFQPTITRPLKWVFHSTNHDLKTQLQPILVPLPQHQLGRWVEAYYYRTTNGYSP